MKNDPLFQDFLNKDRIRTSAEQGLNKQQRKDAYKIYNFYDIVLSCVSGFLIIATIIYTYCASHQIVHQSTDAEILIVLGAIALIMIVIPVIEFVIFKKVINKFRHQNSK